jgi:hypothetical protein
MNRSTWYHHGPWRTAGHCFKTRISWDPAGLEYGLVKIKKKLNHPRAFKFYSILLRFPQKKLQCTHIKGGELFENSTRNQTLKRNELVVARVLKAAPTEVYKSLFESSVLEVS